MTNLRVLALSAFCTALLATSSAQRSAAHSLVADAGTAYQLAIRLEPGERFTEHSDTVDRIDWKLPPARLQAFAAQGVVINEEIRTNLVVQGQVLSLDSGGALISAYAIATVHDVPRGKVVTTNTHGKSSVTTRNTQVGATRYAVEDAPMVELPTAPVRLGATWTTHVAVTTTLGSGMVTFSHVVAALDGNMLRIDVAGSGAITGKEYNLPHLLPGTISLRGSAWFDMQTGLVVQESYRIDNTLVKPAGSSQIGFVEHMDADSDVSVSRAR